VRLVELQTPAAVRSLACALSLLVWEAGSVDGLPLEAFRERRVKDRSRRRSVSSLVGDVLLVPNV
jgi:hypothetical protein